MIPLTQHSFRSVVRRAALASALLLLPAAGLPAAAHAAAPAWQLTLTHAPTNFAPGATWQADQTEYELLATNVGAADSDAATTLTVNLPTGITVSPGANPVDASVFNASAARSLSCTHTSSQAVCATPPGFDPVVSSQPIEMLVEVDVDPGLTEGQPLTATGSITGGGAPAAEAADETTISSFQPSFDFLPGRTGFATSVLDSDGAPVTQAGSHPAQAIIDLGFTSTTEHGLLAGTEGGVRDVRTALPRGLVLNPNATQHCSEAELEFGRCPLESQIGLVAITTSITGATLQHEYTGLYNMDPPAGVPAELGFNALDVGVFVHVDGGVRASDYSLTSDTSEILSRFGDPVLAAKVELWGSPSDPTHDRVRGECSTKPNPGCSVSVDPPHREALLTMPTACSDALSTDASADSWLNPGDFVSRTTQVTDLQGNPTGVSGCDALDFNPQINLQPTTAQADSSSGMDVDLSLPQDGLDHFNQLAEANLKKAVVTLPEGMALNPSAADGLAGCTEAQIGLTQEGPFPQFDNSDPSCPNGSIVGDATVTTPLLPDSIEGTLYLADPDDNPFHSLLSGYLVAQGQGVTIKLAGRFDRDPDTGQITATFDNNPQLPFSDLKLHFKGGDRGVIVTPPECGTYTINSDLVPWSAADPDNPQPSEIVHRSNTFDVTSGPGGGPCPDLTDPSRFTPGFSAGTVSPAAGQFSPFVLKVTRPDGQQSLKQIHLDLPPGLVAKLAGVPRCPQAQIDPGIDGSTNCPASSQIGVVNVGAGAGATPFFLKDQPVYLTDGYQGAPYGLAIDTHAVAGPFDLGHVVLRSTLNVDKDDAQVHVDSEQLPWIIQGIPLHIRSIFVDVNRPGFILTPTNCNPMQVTGTVTGGGRDFDDPSDDTVKPVSSYYQVQGCGGLGFTPHLTGTILNGTQGIHRSDHPNLNFHLAYTPGDANIASVAVTLPQAFQIDQANLGNICSETQLATQECAGRNTVGTASATTPLLGSTLSGPVYAVSGSGGLPKLAVILNGPAADPVHLLVRGITTTVGARIANTFPLVPDTPVTGFDLTLNGGAVGYLVNNTNVCGPAKVKGKGRKAKQAKKKAKRLRKANLTADAFIVAQDGDTLSQKVPIAAQCPKAKKGKKANRGRRANGRRR